MLCLADSATFNSGLTKTLLPYFSLGTFDRKPTSLFMFSSMALQFKNSHYILSPHLLKTEVFL